MRIRDKVHTVTGRENFQVAGAAAVGHTQACSDGRFYWEEAHQPATDRRAEHRTDNDNGGDNNVSEGDGVDNFL